MLLLHSSPLQSYTCWQFIGTIIFASILLGVLLQPEINMLCGSADVFKNPQDDPYYQDRNKQAPFVPNVTDSFSVDIEQIKEYTVKDKEKTTTTTTVTYGMVTMLYIFLIIQTGCVFFKPCMYISFCKK